MDRRRFLEALGLMPLASVALAEGGPAPTKPDLRILNDRPLNAETPPSLLDDPFTPIARHFVRNNGNVPKRAAAGRLDGWSLTVDGEVEAPKTFDLAALRALPVRKAALVIECAGNGRAGYHPRAKGNQWTLGAVGCARYEGVRLADVLALVKPKKSAVFVAYFGEDTHLSGRDTPPISRGVPLAKAMDPRTLLVWSMNGRPLPALHGFPLRLICPGWPGSTSGKWLRRLWVRDRVHDGPKMTGQSYRVPRAPVAPGTKVPDDAMEIIEAMPVKSIITRPASGVQTTAGRPLELAGHAWSGRSEVLEVETSIDFGQTWQPTKLAPPVNDFAWQRWRTEVTFPRPGHYELFARATDRRSSQPIVVPGWNPKGYLNNACHRIEVKVT